MKITKAEVVEIKEGPILMATRLDVEIEGGDFHSILYEHGQAEAPYRRRTRKLVRMMAAEFHRRLEEALQ